MQQPLPFTVLKPVSCVSFSIRYCFVATALTVYGIETSHTAGLCCLAIDVATALTVYGIETHHVDG